MAAKKKQNEQLTLQIEVETDMQWRSLLRREGLIVVDVYAGWAGPCTSMISILKRVKVDVNDDRLWLAIANSDNINDLLMFKDQSEPTWLFIGGGKPIKVVRGANVPKLVGTIKSEFEHELLCMTGKSRRNLISIDDEVSRRRKAEAEAMRLSKLIKEEENTADDLNKLRQQSSIRLMSNTEAYTVLVIQSFLLDTGAVTEIRDALQGDFKIEQERVMNLFESGVRDLFRIPKQTLDPSELLEDFGYIEPEDGEQPFDENIINDDADAVDNQDNQVDGEPTENVDALKKPNRKHKRKMIPINLPAGLEGETLFMLLESVDVRKMIASGKKPDKDSLLQTADDYIQLKVGPVELKDALEHAPYSFHALYGREKYASGVWCPRRYDDKRFVLLNFFPRFVTEILMPSPKGTPKYMLAVYPVEMAADVTKEVDFHKKDILAEGKVKIPPKVAEEMLHSWSTAAAEHGDRIKALTKPQVYALSVDKKNSALMLALQSLEPLHMSYDTGYGKIESAKLFEKLNINVEDIPNPDLVVEKFLARSMPRMESETEIDEPDIPPPRKGKENNDSTEESNHHNAFATAAQSRKSLHGGEIRRESEASRKSQSANSNEDHALKGGKEDLKKVLSTEEFEEETEDN